MNGSGQRVSTVERAYQLAKSGECNGIGQIRERLRAEGYSRADSQISGQTFRSQLKKLCEAAQAKPAADPAE
jgi:hypothetical protein